MLLIRIDGRGGITVDGQVNPDTYWITVGGGLGNGESFEDAAQREVLEESGIRDMALGPRLWDREAVIDCNGERFHAVERYFAERTATTAIALERPAQPPAKAARMHSAMRSGASRGPK